MAKQTWTNVNGTYKKCKSVWRKINGTWVEDIVPHKKVSGIWKECMAYAPDIIYYNQADSELVRYSLNADGIIWSATLSCNEAYDMLVSPDGDGVYLALMDDSYNDSYIYKYNIETGAQEWTHDDTASGYMNRIAIRADGSYVYFDTDDYMRKFSRSGSLIYSVNNGALDRGYGVVLTDNDTRIVVGTYEGMGKAYESNFDDITYYGGDLPSTPEALTLSPDGTEVYAALGTGGLWKMQVSSIGTREELSSTDADYVKASEDGRIYTCRTNYDYIHAYDSTGTQIASLDIGTASHQMSVSGSKKYVASGGQVVDYELSSVVKSLGYKTLMAFVDERYN